MIQFATQRKHAGFNILYSNLCLLHHSVYGLIDSKTKNIKNMYNLVKNISVLFNERSSKFNILKAKFNLPFTNVKRNLAVTSFTWFQTCYTHSSPICDDRGDTCLSPGLH